MLDRLNSARRRCVSAGNAGAPGGVACLLGARIQDCGHFVIKVPGNNIHFHGKQGVAIDLCKAILAILTGGDPTITTSA